MTYGRYKIFRRVIEKSITVGYKCFELIRTFIIHIHQCYVVAISYVAQNKVTYFETALKTYGRRQVASNTSYVVCNYRILKWSMDIFQY